MGDIPEDIIAAAQRATFGWLFEAGILRSEAQPLFDAVAGALVAERERCAQVAQNYLDDTHDPWDRYRSSFLGEDVATAIRSPQKPA